MHRLALAAGAGLGSWQGGRRGREGPTSCHTHPAEGLESIVPAQSLRTWAVTCGCPRPAGVGQPGAPLRTPRPGGTARPGGPGREPSGGSAGGCVYGGGESESGYAACSRPYASGLGKGTREDSPSRGTAEKAAGRRGARRSGPARWPPGAWQPRSVASPSARQRGAVSVDAGLPGPPGASRGLLGPPGVSWGLLGSPGVSESPGAAGGGDREVGGGCRRKLWAGWACGRSDGAGWNVNLPPLTLRPATHLTQPTASQRVSASGGPAAAVG